MNGSGAGEGVWLIADDYALSPGVSRAIRSLIADAKLSGTGCMTLFPEWPSEAPALIEAVSISGGAIGLHLTLTDFPPLSGAASLGAAAMAPLARLIRDCETGRVNERAVHRELDAQLDAFLTAIGHPPHFLDGHQHVHFLGPVRRWLETRRDRLLQDGRLPWLRGAPAIGEGGDLKSKLKSAMVAFLARGFERRMARAGYTLRGPLAGFYDWNRPEAFAPYLHRLAAEMTKPMLVMCHPGAVDDVLRARDGLVAAREAEYAALKNFGGWRVLSARG